MFLVCIFFATLGWYDISMYMKGGILVNSHDPPVGIPICFPSLWVVSTCASLTEEEGRAARGTPRAPVQIPSNEIVKEKRVGRSRRDEMGGIGESSM